MTMGPAALRPEAARAVLEHRGRARGGQRRFATRPRAQLRSTTATLVVAGGGGEMQTRGEMQTWVELMQNNVGSSELDADEFNFGAMQELFDGIF